MKLMTRSDKQLASMMKSVRRRLHRRLSREMCSELHMNCIDCKARVLIGLLNSWIDHLED